LKRNSSPEPRLSSIVPVLLATLSFTIGAPTVQADVVPARIVLAVGDVVPGKGDNTIDSVSWPTTNGIGQVGFVGDLTTGLPARDSYVWIDDEIVWRNTDALPLPLDAGVPAPMGISDAGGFIYKTETVSDDVVISHRGPVAIQDQPPRPFGTADTTIFLSDTTMSPDGRAFWIGEVKRASGLQGRVLFSSADARARSAEVVLSFEDTVEGIPIKENGVRFDYQLTDTGNHIHALSLDTGDFNTERVLYVNGSIVAQAAMPTGGGDRWEVFDLVGINDSGNYIFSGNTDLDESSNEFIAYNGQIVIREGDTLVGIPLTPSARVRSLSLNDLDQAVFVWEYDPPGMRNTETLFFACDAGAPHTTSTALLTTGDELDLDFDGSPDTTVVDFEATGLDGPGLTLAENGLLYVHISIGDVDESREAIVELRLPTCPGV